MKTNLPLLLTATILLGLLWSCKKDDVITSDKYLTTFTAKVENEVTSSVTGYVYDENNKPVADAEVAIYSARTRTNEHGFFVFENKKMDSKGTFIKVRKAGYLPASDMIYPSPGISCFSYVKLLSSVSTGEFISGSGGKVSVSGGANIYFEPSSIVDDKGNLYTGKVSVTARYLNPTADDLGDAMPGALYGSSTSGEKVVLGTLGMVVAELYDINGNLLNIGNGKKATIELPAATQNQPSTIPLWWFDESEGIWVEEGEATLQGQVYRGQVSHFSFWNCDQPYVTAYACLKFVYEDGTPVQGMTVKAIVDSYNSSYSQTDSDGRICSFFPKDKVINLVASQLNCTKEFITGPYAEGTNAEVTFIMPGRTETTILVKCGDLPVSKGIIKFRSVGDASERTFFMRPDGDGVLKVDIKLFNFCNASSPVYVSAFDNITGNTSGEKQLDNLQAINIIDVCEVKCEFSAVLDITKTADNPPNYTASCIVTGGSGNFSYQWQKGETTSSIQLAEDFERVCVIVEDKTAKCTKTYCKSKYLSGCDNLNVLCDVTTTGWCGKTDQFEILFKKVGNNTYDLFRTDKNEADFSMGAYAVCYGPSATLPGGDLKLVITDCNKLSYTGKSRWGETYFVREVRTDGDKMYLSWKNDYDPEAGESILKRKDGLTWPPLVK